MARRIRIALLTRRPRPRANHSVELILDGLMQHIAPDFEVVRSVSRFYSNGVLPRLYNVVEAAVRQADVNHVPGDVHFLTYLLRKKKTVLTVLDCGPLCGGGSRLRRGLISLLWYQIPVRRCAAITVISHSVKQDLIKYTNVEPEKVHVIPVAVPSHYTRVDKPFESRKPVVLQVGTAANKNLLRLIEALAGIPCRLDIVGKLNDECLLALERNAVEHRSYVGLTNEEMLTRYIECDVVAFASTFEGFGMPIVEANLVGRPVVTGNVASMPEVAGDAACLVDPFDVASIRAGILKVIQEPEYRANLVRAGFANAQRYNTAAITKQYEEVYRRVARKSLADL